MIQGMGDSTHPLDTIQLYHGEVLLYESNSISETEHGDPHRSMPCACLFPRCTRGEEHKSPHPFLRELAEERQILVNPSRRIGPPSRVLKPWDVPSSLNHLICTGESHFGTNEFVPRGWVESTDPPESLRLLSVRARSTTLLPITRCPH